MNTQGQQPTLSQWICLLVLRYGSTVTQFHSLPLLTINRWNKVRYFVAAGVCQLCSRSLLIPLSLSRSLLLFSFSFSSLFLLIHPHLRAASDDERENRPHACTSEQLSCVPLFALSLSFSFLQIHSHVRSGDLKEVTHVFNVCVSLSFAFSLFPSLTLLLCPKLLVAIAYWNLPLTLFKPQGLVSLFSPSYIHHWQGNGMHGWGLLELFFPLSLSLSLSFSPCVSLFRFFCVQLRRQEVAVLTNTERIKEGRENSHRVNREKERERERAVALFEV